MPDLNLVLPVFALEGVLITKLIALRDNDIVDIISLLSQHADQISAEDFWDRANTTDLELPLKNRLDELEQMLVTGEADAIWWDRLGLLLDMSTRQSALDVVNRLHNHFTTR
jgi:hypothetical protein